MGPSDTWSSNPVPPSNLKTCPKNLGIILNISPLSSIFNDHKELDKMIPQILSHLAKHINMSGAQY